MGEIAEMILEGVLCDVCGVYLGPTPDSENFDENEEFEPCGFPQTCSDCGGD